MIWTGQMLERRLERWVEAGWVTPAGAAAIRAELASGGSRLGLAGSLAILCAVLLGFAAMTFVAANWSDMSRLGRLGLLLGSMWASYAGAAALFERKLDRFGHAAVLLGCSIFGAAIMLVAQMYHLDGNPPDAVLVWGAGSLLAGLLLRSAPALTLTMCLTALWVGWETGVQDRVFWWAIPAWAVVTAALWRERSRHGLHLAALAASAWIVSLGATLGTGHHFGIVAAVGAIAAIGSAVVADSRRDRVGVAAAAAFPYALSVAFAGLFILQFVEKTSLGSLLALAVLTLGGLVAAIVWAERSRHRSGLWLAYAAFSVELLGLYEKTIGSLLDTSLFFLIAGLIVAGLAALAYKLNERRASNSEKAP